MRKRGGLSPLFFSLQFLIPTWRLFFRDHSYPILPPPKKLPLCWLFMVSATARGGAVGAQAPPNNFGEIEQKK